MTGRTLIHGSDIEWRQGQAAQKNEFQVRYEEPLSYRVDTRGLRWNLSSLVNDVLEDQELKTQVEACGLDKKFDDELVMHTAAHLLHKAFSAISGVNEQELEYLHLAEERQVLVWERFEGGAGLTEVVRDVLRSQPMRFFEEMLANCLCPVALAESNAAGTFDVLRKKIIERWRLPSDSTLVQELIAEAQAERTTLDAQVLAGQETRNICTDNDGCPVCIYVTDCTARREQPSRVSRLVAEAILSRLVRRFDRATVEARMAEASQLNIEPPLVLWADQTAGEYDALVL
jgi:hypothetical protein